MSYLRSRMGRDTRCCNLSLTGRVPRLVPFVVFFSWPSPRGLPLCLQVARRNTSSYLNISPTQTLSTGTITHNVVFCMCRSRCKAKMNVRTLIKGLLRTCASWYVLSSIKDGSCHQVLRSNYL